MNYIKSFIIILILLSPVFLLSQSSYQKGIEALNEGKIEAGIELLEKAKKKGNDKAKATLALAYVQTFLQPFFETPTKTYLEYAKQVDDPSTSVFAMWYDDAIFGEQQKLTTAQLELCSLLLKNENLKGKNLESVKYTKLIDHFRRTELKEAEEISSIMTNIVDWSFVGPFDNVMNSGHSKSFGPLENPKNNSTFKSKYGADIKWFSPKPVFNTGYVLVDNFFSNSNYLMYAQTFVELNEDKRAKIKFGYTGTATLWVNDQQVHSINEYRSTEMDHYVYEVDLKKGQNRILLKLGDYGTSYPNFAISLTDINDEALSINASSEFKEYSSAPINSKEVPHFAISDLKNRISTSTDYFDNVLLAKAYMRSRDYDMAEKSLKPILEKYPNSFFGNFEMFFIASKRGDETTFKKYRDLLDKNYGETFPLVLADFEEALEKSDQKNYEKYRDKLIKLGIDDELEDYFGVLDASYAKENLKAIELLEKGYNKYPDSDKFVSLYFRVQKNMGADNDKLDEILEKYISSNRDHNYITELVSRKVQSGNVSEAIDILVEANKYANGANEYDYSVINLYAKQLNYDKAIELLNEKALLKPYSYGIYKDLSKIHESNGNKKQAILNLEKAIEYFPFSFEMNEELRELKGLKKLKDFVPEYDHKALIEAYNDNDKNYADETFVVVHEQRNVLLFSTTSTAIVHRYIIKINDEKAINRWQNIDFAPGAYRNLEFNEVKLIKPSGSEIDADVSGGSVVFTNIEVGDFIFVDFEEQQYSGGKTSSFMSESQEFSGYIPFYESEYNVFTDGKVNVNYEMINFDKKPKEKSLKDNVKKYSWSVKNTPMMVSESYDLPYSDIGPSVHISLGYSWGDVVQWYQDLSKMQALSDLTIQEAAAALFKGKNNLSKEEKSKIIYNYVCKTIQYSFVDFRQGSYVPQKASDVLNSRLGDCKDVSTLFVALANEVDLDANLVLINTRDNGKKDVVLPSLNFNHCIVKVYLDNDESHFLELTNSSLPYGCLNASHNGAAILEIKEYDNKNQAQLEYLKPNNAFSPSLNRISTVVINNDNSLDIQTTLTIKGSVLANYVDAYHYTNEKDGNEKLLSQVSRRFKSSVRIKDKNFKSLLPLKESGSYDYSFTVEDDVLKLGSMKTIKIPFGDLLVNKELFEKEDRNTPLNFLFYEDVEEYSETMTIKLEGDQSFKEIPESVSYSFNNFSYKLEVTKKSDSEIIVNRTYTSEPIIVEAKDYNQFREFVKKVYEAENTHLLF